MKAFNQYFADAWQYTSGGVKNATLAALLGASLMYAPNARADDDLILSTELGALRGPVSAPAAKAGDGYRLNPPASEYKPIRAGDDDWPRPFAIEIEPIKVSQSVNTGVRVYPDKEFRTLKSHPDDPPVAIEPLQERPYKMKVESNVADIINVKAWVYETIALGVGIRAGGPSSPDTRDGYDGYLGLDPRQSGYYNYRDTGIPGVGGAFVYNTTSMYTHSNSLRYFIEAKTPGIPLFTCGDAPVNLSAFAGYEPDVAKIDMEAEKGYHRWSSPQPTRIVDLGTIDYDRAYVGLAITRYGDDSNSFGVRLFCERDLADVNLTETGKMFGTTVEKPGNMFGVSLEFTHKF